MRVNPMTAPGKRASNSTSIKAKPVKGLTARQEAELLAALEAQEQAACQESLYGFLLAAWPVLEPGRVFQANWHHRAICDHLEAVTQGRIKRLVINIPPRSTKSTLVSVMWPVWTWLHDPTREFLTGSHNLALAVRDALKSRRLMESNWFLANWPTQGRFAKDQNQKTRYELAEGGVRIAFGMGSGVTGEGGDFLVIDDPHPAKEGMWSQANRAAVKEAYDYELFNRLNDAAASAIVIVMQRLHEDDLTGHVLSVGESWVHLRLPMEYEPGAGCATELGFEDPRAKAGELLHPARFNPAWLAGAKERLGAWGTAGQLQQRPAPLGGGVVKLEWFRRYDALPDTGQWQQVIQAWDTASKADELLNCPWVCGTWVVTETGIYLKDVYRQWMDYPQGKRAVLSLAERDKPGAIVIEDASTGASLLQELGQESMLPLIPFRPRGDKVMRLALETPLIEAGKVYLPRSAAWLADYESELASFPKAATQDQADMTSMALNYLRADVQSPQLVDNLFL
jgi:predicted phage terminase large subunit-like protein